MFTLDEALKAVEGRKEFLVRRDDGLVVFNYLIQLPDSFEGIRREFRGLTFDEKSGAILSLPLHKFMNLNQTEETQFEKLKHLNGKIYEKMDGSLVHLYEHRGELRASTRMSSDTIQAKEAFRLAGKLGMIDEIRKEVKSGYTPIFEYVAPNNQIVVEYGSPRLVYLHSRNRSTGEYVYHPYKDCAKTFDFKFADVFSFLEGKEEFEGYVIVLENGLWVKAKCNWYLERHRAVDALMRPAYRLYEVVFDGLMDDLIAKAPDRHKTKLREIYTVAQLDLLNEMERVQKISDAIMKEASTRKDYALTAQALHKDIFGSLMTAYDHRNLEEGIKKRLLEGYKKKYPNRLFSGVEVDDMP